MEKIKEIKELIYPASSVWSIISDISRCDWVPGVESIELEGNKRVFKMQGMGRLVEEILSCDNDEMKLTYSAIENIAPIYHHLATIKLTERDDKTIFELFTNVLCTFFDFFFIHIIKQNCIHVCICFFS